MSSQILRTAMTYGTLAACAALSFVLPDHLRPAAVRAEPPPTGIDEVVMYGVDSDTNQLLRYGFDSNEYRVIGTVLPLDSTAAEDFESLAYVPAGPHVGLYTSPQSGPNDNHLVRVSMIDASAKVYPANIGFGDVVGMLAVEEAGSVWSIYATTTTQKLISIDLETGVGTLITDLSRSYDGLTAGPDGTLFAVHYDELWTIDPATGDETEIGSHGFAKIEALEYAFGDADPGITAPGVPAAWTANGMLFGFSDTNDTLIILDPATGDAMAWDTPIDTPDCEGFVFMTKRTDPVYRVVHAPFD